MKIFEKTDEIVPFFMWNKTPSNLYNDKKDTKILLQPCFW